MASADKAQAAAAAAARKAQEEGGDSSDDDEDESDDEEDGDEATSPAAAAAKRIADNPFLATAKVAYRSGAMDSRADLGKARQAVLPPEQSFQIPFPIAGGPAHVRFAQSKGLFGGVSWSARYVAVGRGGIHFFAKQGDSKPKSRIDLRMVADAEVAPFSEAGKPHSASLLLRDGRSMILSFASDEARNTFLAVMLGVIQLSKEAVGQHT